MVWNNPGARLSPARSLTVLFVLTIPLLLVTGPGAGTHADTQDPSPLPIYTEVTDAAGLGDFRNGGFLGTGDSHDQPPFFMETAGPGACWFDHDGDDRLDLYLVSGKYLTHPDKNDALDPHSRLYRNDGDGTFTDVTQAAGARTSGVLQACAVADHDNDGDPDLYVSGWGHSTLLRNDGGTFTNVTAHAGVADDDCGAFACWASAPTWFDADQDGCLDLFVGHFTEYDMADPFDSNGPGPGQVNRFYRNDCDGSGRFTDATDAAGLGGIKSDTWAAVSADLDNDGDPDLYVANDGDENDLYLNDGDGTFTRKTFTTAADDRAGMGIAVGDYDHSGKLDMVVTHFIREHNAVLQAFGNDYLDVGSNGAFKDAFDWSGWGTRIYDMDNDGHPDIMVVNGDTEDHGVIPKEHPLLFYHNQGGGVFEAATGRVGADTERDLVGRAGAWADYDDDGDIDVLVTEAGDNPTHLFRADGVGNRFLNIDLATTAAGVNREAIGARVTVTAAGLPAQMQEKITASGFMGSNDPRLHFGLADADDADVQVTWPDGSVETFVDVSANTFVRITQGAGLETLRVLPRLTMDLPSAAVERKEVFDANVEVRLPDGRSVTGATWTDGAGSTDERSDEINTTLRYHDVGSFVVRVAVRDDAGTEKTAWGMVSVIDTLGAEVAMDRPTFLPTESPTGQVEVRFSDGDPVPAAHVHLTIQRTTDDPDLDERIGQLPYFLRELGGWLPVEQEATTDANGTLRFQVPHNVVSPSPFVPTEASHPGAYVVTVDGGARGSTFPQVSARYAIGAQPTTT